VSPILRNVGLYRHVAPIFDGKSAGDRSPRNVLNSAVPTRGRKMKTLIGLCLVSSALMLGGCGKDAEVEEFIKENDALAKEIKDSKSAEDSKKVWDGKKDGFKKKYDGIKEARGFQVKEETTKKLTDSMTASTIAVCDPTSAGINPDVCKEYTEVFK
jgi:hypothetical protein